MSRLRYLLCVLLLITPAHACLWDEDTLATEAKGLPDVVQVITGRFPRNPPLFYEMRLSRVAKEIQTQPAKLNLYDDAAVACDRLHRDKEAIAWMAKKRAQLKPFPQDKEHWYRYHANVGTFQAHDWLRSGANRQYLSEMKMARDNIAQAIKINPNAHFGREKYQLMAMEWIIKPPKKSGAIPDFLGLGDKMVWDSSPRLKTQREAIRGLCGLITLGGAWESVDAFYALELALATDQESSVAHLANLRMNELLHEGHHTLYPGATLSDVEQMSFYKLIPLTQQKDYMWQGTDEVFSQMRREADAWQEKRTSYMTEHLNAGRHPDTDVTFWTGWKDTAPPAIPEIISPQEKLKHRIQMAMTIGFCSLIILIAYALWRSVRKRRLAA